MDQTVGANLGGVLSDSGIQETPTERNVVPPSGQSTMSSSALSRSHSISSLDGLRAISILLVLSLHTLQRLDQQHTASLIWYAIFNGGSGVSIFFVISGFLITSLLLREAEKRGSFSLRGFYLRRAFRILPPLYLYIGVVVLLGVFGLTITAPIDIVSAAFFFHNIAGGPTWSLEHLWSISIEEQFYLVWPFVLAYSLSSKSGSGRVKAAIFPATVILLSPIARILLRKFGNEAMRFASVHALNFDFIMFGCLIALLQNTARFESVYRASTKYWYLPPIVILVCNGLGTVYENYFNLTIGNTVQGFAIAMFLLWCTRNPETIIGKFLNCRVMTTIGVLSYSIYLWQTLFLHHLNSSVFAFAPWLGRLPLNWPGIFIAALLSYNLIEQPALRLRDRVVRYLNRNTLPEAA